MGRPFPDHEGGRNTTTHMKNTNTNALAVTASIGELKGLITAGLEAWQKAGAVVVRLLDEAGMTLEEIVAKADCDVITVDVLSSFERIGRKQVLPKLLVSPFPAARAMQRLPMSEQQRLMDGTVELVLLRDGKVDVLQVRPEHLTRQQVKQVFERGMVRSLAGQRAWLEEQLTDKEQAKAVKQAVPWIVRHGKVIFREACEMTRQELAMLLTQLA